MKPTDARRNVQSSRRCVILLHGKTQWRDTATNQIPRPNLCISLSRSKYCSSIIGLTLLSPSGILNRLHTRSRLPPSIPLPHLRSSSPPLYRLPINPVTHLEHLTIRHRLIRIPIDDQVTRHENDQTCDGSARRLGVDHGYPVLDLFEWEGLRSRRMSK